MESEYKNFKSFARIGLIITKIFLLLLILYSGFSYNKETFTIVASYKISKDLIIYKLKMKEVDSIDKLDTFIKTSYEI